MPLPTGLQLSPTRYIDPFGVNDTAAISKKRRGARIRVIGLLVWMLGLAAAGALYWYRTSGAADNPLLTGYDRPQMHQMGVLYGKMGLMIQDLSEDFKRPGTQAVLLAGASTLFGLSCFYLARGEEG